MNKNRGLNSQNKGFIQVILAIIVIVLILTFLRLDLRALAESDTGKTNFAYVWELLVKLWHWFWDLIVALGQKLAAWLAGLTK